MSGKENIPVEIYRKKQLEMILQKVPQPSNPKPELEQYLTPANIAADLLWNAKILGDINKKVVVDLGCGTGIFSIGSSLLGAKKVLGIDIDEDVIKTAESLSRELKLKNILFLKKNVLKISKKEIFQIVGEVDTLIQNPPFGIQKSAKKGMDKKFIKKALELSKVIYSFHAKGSGSFIKKYFEKHGGKVTHVFQYTFPIPCIYEFHREEIKNVDVIVFRVLNYSLI
ncbi:methyltransferase [Methanothermus fervidus DSM 2088]|uniref:Methyltransferase n=1 Tax=Methanothermus fervidus (strain ATCC 43054 / DSM 2088 / JCM 10308 / V24 S) TaxID=523846 RepID=E3GX32_METFV|nr:METTL5 family protein [Methanothermus fervidus]ADP76921.1 methyltransferase [Methanothermus fervidus DSM 2088]